VTISSPPTFARVVLLPRLKDFAARYPEVEVAINLAIPLLDLNAGDADVEIRTLTARALMLRILSCAGCGVAGMVDRLG
jgi:DNA-binding transcriptional LysR family regulator